MDKAVNHDQSQITIRSYADGDERLVLVGFNRVFGQMRTLEHWTWKFKKNPYGKQVMAALAFNSQGNLVGHYCLIPLKLNLSGRAVLAAQSVDTFVLDEWRAKGVFVRSASHCYDKCLEEGVVAVYGFPNEKSYPGFMRKLAWFKIAHLAKYRYRLGLKALVTNILRVPWLPCFLEKSCRMVLRLKFWARSIALTRQLGIITSFHLTSGLPKDYNELWEVCKDREPISVWKDEEYLTWRYLQNPDRMFQFCSLRFGDSLLALAVLWMSANETFITELFTKRKDVGLAKKLVLEIIKFSLSRGKNAVSFIGHDSGFFQKVFSDFTVQPLFDSALCGKTLQGNLRFNIDFSIPTNWTITYGDLDAL